MPERRPDLDRDYGRLLAFEGAEGVIFWEERRHDPARDGPVGRPKPKPTALTTDELILLRTLINNDQAILYALEYLIRMDGSRSYLTTIQKRRLATDRVIEVFGLEEVTNVR